MRKIMPLLFCLACSGCGNETPPTTEAPRVSGNAAGSTSPTGSEADTPPASNSTATETASTANANVTSVRAVAGRGSWAFHVTVDHPDTGWKDYADGWDVVLPDGTVVKPDADSPFTRLLLHPHENERPFTRSQSRILIPAEVTSVTVRAHDLVHGFGGSEVVVDLESAAGKGFTVER